VKEPEEVQFLYILIAIGTPEKVFKEKRRSF
jgi:hypothetical protein